MKDDKESLAALGSKLAEKMQELTSQFKLGFGSFVDKVVMPYVNVHKSKWIFFKASTRVGSHSR